MQIIHNIFLYEFTFSFIAIAHLKQFAVKYRCMVHFYRKTFKRWKCEFIPYSKFVYVCNFYFRVEKETGFCNEAKYKFI